MFEHLAAGMEIKYFNFFTPEMDIIGMNNINGHISIQHVKRWLGKIARIIYLIIKQESVL